MPTNNWTKLILLLVVAGIVSAVVMTLLPVGPARATAFWLLTVPITVLLLISGVGWAYSEIMIREHDAQAQRIKSSRRTRSQAAQIFSYLAILVLVAGLAIGGALIPARYAPLIWTVYIPGSFIAAWYLRVRRARSQNRRGDR